MGVVEKVLSTFSPLSVPLSTPICFVASWSLRWQSRFFLLSPPPLSGSFPFPCVLLIQAVGLIVFQRSPTTLFSSLSLPHFFPTLELFQARHGMISLKSFFSSLSRISAERSVTSSSLLFGRKFRFLPPPIWSPFLLFHGDYFPFPRGLLSPLDLSLSLLFQSRDNAQFCKPR